MSVSPRDSSPRLDREATEQLVERFRLLEEGEPFSRSRRIASLLGGACLGDNRGRFVFWTPELEERFVAPEAVYLELLLPPEDLDLTLPEQQVPFTRRLIPTARVAGCTVAVVDGVTGGSREKIGTFYALSYLDEGGRRQRIVDPLAASVPFGAAAPAELYDMDALQRGRGDREYFRSLLTEADPDGTPRVAAPSNMLEIHVATATEEGSLRALAARYRQIGGKLEAGQPLTPGERSYVGYDAVQLMPVEPTIPYEAGPLFWEELEQGSFDREGAHPVTLRRPDTSNWGYDVITVASPAANPTLLATGRPDELLDLVTTLHTLPGQPVKVVLDIVYGHADNQALSLLNHHYFAGSNMYGQNLNYQNPMVRSILLEMQWRKSQYGVDGIRVDGAQDFKYWVADEDKLYHDDEYLGLMNDLVQEVAGVRYRPWMVFEDGRPWPRDDWELSSTYREVTKQFPNVVQWGPLTFAHNTPFLFTFWISKWWRIEEIARYGSHWITGTSNHDTLRRGTQVDPQARINTYLGETLPEIFKEAYDSPGTRLFDLAMPGIPMDFLNANSRAPWSFFRNSDDTYGVKVMSEEALFLDWAVEDSRFDHAEAFERTKAWGFTSRAGLKRFVRALDSAVRSTDYDLPGVAAILNAYQPPLSDSHAFTPETLKRIARGWMDDVRDYCKVPRYESQLDEERSAFSLELRRFRRRRSWLTDDLGEGEFLGRLPEAAGSVIFYLLRRSPDGGEELLFVENMEGAPYTVTPRDLPIPGLKREGWKPALVVPGVRDPEAGRPLKLRNGQGVLFSRRGG
ncbi:MAG: glucosylglycerol hydrolase [Spirochaetaceae bacterium]